MDRVSTLGGYALVSINSFYIWFLDKRCLKRKASTERKRKCEKRRWERKSNVKRMMRKGKKVTEESRREVRGSSEYHD